MELADGHSLDRLLEPFPSSSQRNNFSGGLDQPLNLILVLREFVSQLLHFFQQIFTLVQLEVGLGKVRVQVLFLLLHPFLGFVTFTEELKRGGDMPKQKKFILKNELLCTLCLPNKLTKTVFVVLVLENRYSIKETCFANFFLRLFLCTRDDYNFTL